ncbi:MAG: MarR family transcriptional regulator [Paludibacteraceae bacterium]|nr:MarR family transcriptional regulator [Paludibacteraceae bacterium]
MIYEQLKLDNQLCFRLYTAARLVANVYQPYFAKLGITYPQYLVLLILWENDQQTVMEITHRLRLDTNTVTPLLQRMEKAGLISRTKSKEDTRVRIITLTDKGKDLQEQAKDIPACLSSELECKIGNLTQLKQIIPVLDQLIDGLTKIATKTNNNENKF